jgi:hypothetical protein
VIAAVVGAFAMILLQICGEVRTFPGDSKECISSNDHTRRGFIPVALQVAAIGPLHPIESQSSLR